MTDGDLKLEYDTIMKDNKAKESEITVLQDELTEKNKSIDNLIKENKRVCDENQKKTIRINSICNDVETTKRDHET